VNRECGTEASPRVGCSESLCENFLIT